MPTHGFDSGPGGIIVANSTPRQPRLQVQAQAQPEPEPEPEPQPEPEREPQPERQPQAQPQPEPEPEPEPQPRAGAEAPRTPAPGSPGAQPALGSDSWQDADEAKAASELMRPHVGSRVKVVSGDGSGCLAHGEVGTVVEDDRSPIPFKVAAPNGDTSWYREDQLEHLAEYTVEDVIDQQRLVSLYGDTSVTSFNVSGTRFSWQGSRARERTADALHPRSLHRGGRRASVAVGRICCPWCMDERNRAQLRCLLYLSALLFFVVGFTASHAVGYRSLKYDLQHDKYQWQFDRNDGCLATQQMLGVVHGRGVDWPTPPPPVPPRMPLLPAFGPGKPAHPQDEAAQAHRACLEEQQEDLLRPSGAGSRLEECARTVDLHGCQERSPTAPSCCPASIAASLGCYCDCKTYDAIRANAHDPPPPPPERPSAGCIPAYDLQGLVDYPLPQDLSLEMPCLNGGVCKFNSKTLSPTCRCNVQRWGGPTCEREVPPGFGGQGACNAALEASCGTTIDHQGTAATLVSCKACATRLLTDPSGICNEAWVSEWCRAVVPAEAVPCDQRQGGCAECQDESAGLSCGWCPGVGNDPSNGYCLPNWSRCALAQPFLAQGKCP